MAHSIALNLLISGEPTWQKTKKLYVGNIAYTMNDNSLKQAFEEYGEVVSARIITDRDTGRSKGFGFVEMATLEGAQAAIEALNDTDIDGRVLKVNEARPQTDRPRR